MVVNMDKNKGEKKEKEKEESGGEAKLEISDGRAWWLKI